MAAKINWQKYGTKLRHCHPMYTQSRSRGGSTGRRGKRNVSVEPCAIHLQELTERVVVIFIQGKHRDMLTYNCVPTSCARLFDDETASKFTLGGYDSRARYYPGADTDFARYFPAKTSASLSAASAGSGDGCYPGLLAMPETRHADQQRSTMLCGSYVNQPSAGFYVGLSSSEPSTSTPSLHHERQLADCHASPRADATRYFHSTIHTGGSVVEWSACWTQAQ